MAEVSSPAEVRLGMSLSAKNPARNEQSSRRIPLTAFPTEVRQLMSELDVDGSGQLEVSELTQAMLALKESKKRIKSMSKALFIMLGIMALLVASVFGVSYAAADLAAKVKTNQGVLTDSSGNVVRTGGPTVSASTSFAATDTTGNITAARSLNEAEQGSSSGSDIIAPAADGYEWVMNKPATTYKFAARRKYAGRATSFDEQGRRLQTIDANNVQLEPAQLVELGVMPSSLADEVCRLVNENHFEIFLRGFTPVPNTGASGFLATIDPSSVKGCTPASRSSHGFSADFTGKLFSFQPGVTTFHIDCVAPLTDSVCTITQEIVKIVPPSLAALVAEPTNETVVAAIMASGVQEEPSRRLAEGRGLQSTYNGKGYATAQFPPLAPPLVDEFYPSPVLATYRLNRPPGVTNPKPWITGVVAHNFYYATPLRYTLNATWINTMRFNATARPYDNALLACSTSYLCLAGWENYVYRVFKQEYYMNGADGLSRRLAAAFSAIPRTTIVTEANIDAAVKQYTYTLTDLATASRLQGQTAVVVWGQCPAGQVPRFTGVTDPNSWYTCQPWNTVDINAGAQQIAASCVNAFEVLEWYFTWWKLYRIADYTTPSPPAGANWAYPGPATYRFDYCTYTGSWWKTNIAIGSHWNPTDPVTLSTNYGGYSLNTICNNGRPVPNCQTPKFVLKWT